MAAPPDATIKSLSGTWVLDRKLSDDPDAVFKMQGLSWLGRKAIGVCTINTEFSQFTEADIVHLTVNQSAAGGAGGTAENRVLDWVDRPHSDNIFGNVVVRSRFVDGIDDGTGNIRPDFDLQTVGSDGSFLKETSSARGEKIVEDLSSLFLHDYIVSADRGWTAEQIWAFELIDGERFLTRRAITSKGSKFLTTRVIYRFVKE